MLYYILGIITGLILSIIFSISIHRNETDIKRTIKRVESYTAKKGVLIEPKNEELQDWANSLKNI